MTKEFLDQLKEAAKPDTEIVSRPSAVRNRLPSERSSITHKFKIGEHKGYLSVGFYPDGGVGEIFVKMDQQGSQVSGFADAWSIAVSLLLQTGTPLEDICKKFKATRFEPAGLTGNPNIRCAQSPIDYIVRYLEGRFVNRNPEWQGKSLAELIPRKEEKDSD